MLGMAQRLFIENTKKNPWKVSFDEDLSSWLFLEKMIVEKRLAYIDLALAQNILRDQKIKDESTAALICHLSQATRQGHLCITIEDDCITPSPEKLWCIAEGEESISAENTASIMKEIEQLIISGIRSIPAALFSEVADEASEKMKPLCKKGNHFYFQRYWQMESVFVKAAKYLMTVAGPSLIVNPDKVRFCVEQLLNNGKLMPEQAEAVLKGCFYPFTVITGGPGTGKTYTAGTLLSVLWECLDTDQRALLKIELAAPTGKAAANLESSIQRALQGVKEFPSLTAKTLHGLLGVKGRKRHQKNLKTLQADILLVDESSMIDVEMMGLLMASLKPGARLILLGDRHQLPPVESGSLFTDLVAFLMAMPNAQASVTELKKCLRSELQGILDLAEKIKCGDEKAVLEILGSEHKTLEGIKYVPLEISSSKDIQRSIVSYALKRFPFCNHIPDDPKIILDEFLRFRILSPLRKGPLGVETLNMLFFKEYFNQARHSECIAVPIMIAQNDVRTGLVNGEIGLLMMHRQKNDDFAFFSLRDASHEFRKIPLLLLPKFEYAYCLSVHKSQGSEFDHVVMLLPEGAENFGREALYTGVTRARRFLELWAAPSLLCQMIKTTSKRHSTVIERLQSN